MALRHVGDIPLPPHQTQGGFDHAAVHRATSRLYVAHTANDAVEVINCEQDLYMHHIPGLIGVAGVLASDDYQMLFTSNRGENTVSIISVEPEMGLARIRVGVRPNGLAFDPRRKRLLAANVGDPQAPHSFTVSLVDVAEKRLMHDVPVPGRTRWAFYDAVTDAFYVNIADPAQIVVLSADDPSHIARHLDIPVAGPHGLDLDPDTGRLFCACDGKALVTLDKRSGATLAERPLSGVPDVIFYNPALRHLYVASGDPGVIDVFDTDAVERIETVSTEKGAHTIAFDAVRNKVYAFLPQSCRAAVYVDSL